MVHEPILLPSVSFISNLELLPGFFNLVVHPLGGHERCTRWCV